MRVNLTGAAILHGYCAYAVGAYRVKNLSGRVEPTFHNRGEFAYIALS